MKVIFVFLSLVFACYACKESLDCLSCIKQAGCVLVEFKSTISCVEKSAAENARSLISRKSQCHRIGMMFSKALLTNYFERVNSLSDAKSTLTNKSREVAPILMEPRENPPLIFKDVHMVMSKSSEIIETENQENIEASNATFHLSTAQVPPLPTMHLNESVTENQDVHMGFVKNITVVKSSNISANSDEKGDDSQVILFSWDAPNENSCDFYKGEKWIMRLERAYCTASRILSSHDRKKRVDHVALALHLLNPSRNHERQCNYVAWYRSNCHIK